MYSAKHEKLSGMDLMLDLGFYFLRMYYLSTMEGLTSFFGDFFP
jgi:hypothetical protein